MEDHPFSDISNLTDANVLRQELFADLCEADRESFVVVGRSPALLMSGLIIALLCYFVGIVAFLFFKFQQRVGMMAKVKKFEHIHEATTEFGDIEESIIAISSNMEVKPLSVSLGMDSTNQSTRAALAMQETAIYCRDLSYFPSAKAKFPILKQVSVQMCYGSLVAVMGPSGSGKVSR